MDKLQINRKLNTTPNGLILRQAKKTGTVPMVGSTSVKKGKAGIMICEDVFDFRYWLIKVMVTGRLAGLFFSKFCIGKTGG